MEAPKGYTLDPQSGKYYHTMQVTDPASGATAQLTTWFDPESGSYTRVARQTGEPTIQQPIASSAPSGAAAHKPSSKKRLHLLLGGLAALTAVVVGICVWQSGWIDTLWGAPATSGTASSDSPAAPSKESIESPSEESSAVAPESSSALPKASDFVRGAGISSSSSSSYTPPTSVPAGLILGTWYQGFVERDGGLVRPATAPLLTFWRDGRVSILYEFLSPGGSSITTSLYGGYRIDGNEIICTIDSVLTIEDFKPEDLPEFVFEVTEDGVVCTEGSDSIPFVGMIFHPEE